MAVSQHILFGLPVYRMTIPWVKNIGIQVIQGAGNGGIFLSIFQKTMGDWSNRSGIEMQETQQEPQGLQGFHHENQKFWEPLLGFHQKQVFSIGRNRTDMKLEVISQITCFCLNHE